MIVQVLYNGNDEIIERAGELLIVCAICAITGVITTIAMNGDNN